MRAKHATEGPKTLAAVLASLERNRSISDIRRRDLRSAVNRVARLHCDEPARIRLDIPAISQRLASVMPVAAGFSHKTFANVRSDFLAAVRTSGVMPTPPPAKTPMSPSWSKLMAGQSSKRVRLGLSRFARWCSGKGIDPAQVSDAALEEFIDSVKRMTLHRKPNELHRNVAGIWNEVTEKSRSHLRRVVVPSFRRATKRVAWTGLPQSFRNDLEAYLNWCGGSDEFAADARWRALAPQTVELQKNHVHAAVTALVGSGISPKTIKSLGGLVTIENFKRILRRRHDMVDGRENVFNRDLARTLIEIARRWVKASTVRPEELKRLAGKLPAPPSGLTDKNKATLRQFDDPSNLRRLVELPDRLWAEVKRDKMPSLLKAQAALAIGMLCYMPIRPQNLWSLRFDEHIFLHEGRGAVSSLELPAREVKNRTELAFDIPAHLAKMLIEYRNRITPKAIGRRPDRLFIKADGTAKNQWSVSWLIRTYIRKRAGLQLSPHQFRHLSAKVALDAEPGSFETVRQLLGHKSLDTTVNAYAGISSRRAARHHQRLLEQTLVTSAPTRDR
jgi:integrase